MMIPIAYILRLLGQGHHGKYDVAAVSVAIALLVFPLEAFYLISQPLRSIGRKSPGRDLSLERPLP